MTAGFSFNLPGLSVENEDVPTALMLPESLPHSFLTDGHCTKGTRFRIRMTYPTDVSGIHLEPSEHDRTVEFVMNDKHFIRFERRHPAPTRHYTLTCTRSFWPGGDSQDASEMVVAEFDLDRGRLPSGYSFPIRVRPF